MSFVCFCCGEKRLREPELLCDDYSALCDLLSLTWELCALSCRCGQGERPAVPELRSDQRGAHSPRFGQSGPEAAQHRQLQEAQHQEDRLIGCQAPPSSFFSFSSPSPLTLHSTFYLPLRPGGRRSGRFCGGTFYVLLEASIRTFGGKGVAGRRRRRSSSSGVSCRCGAVDRGRRGGTRRWTLQCDPNGHLSSPLYIFYIDR